MILGLTEKQFPESVRVFALTLYFHSPRAYNYLRQRFNNNLPHPKTLQKWYSLSSSNGKPGISEDALHVLKKLSEDMNANDQRLLCSLSMDEMSIRRHVQYSDAEKVFYGRITYGFRTNADGFEVAKNAIVFMISGINENFNIPVAFHFIKELNSEERASLLREVLTNVTALNIRVVNVTFDGLPANIKMCKHMGASFSRKDFRPYFTCPDATNKVYVILDPSHMLKLVRNALGTYKVLYDDNNNKIQWKYIEELELFRCGKGYALAHKLTKKHIQWNRAPMRVHLAAETLSGSVANAMEFLKSKGHKEFSECDATVHFIRLMNNIFDALNSKKVTSADFKTSITSNNHLRLFSYFQQAIQYILSLRTEPKGTRLVYSRRRTAFRGLVIDMMNIQHIFHDLVGSNLTDNLHTFSFSQDPLESLFGRIRSLNGSNDNPNVQQFCGAFRKVTVNTELNCSTFSNCKDSLNILTISSSKSKIDNATCNTNCHFTVNEYLAYIEENHERAQIHSCDYTFEDLEDCSTAEVASMIEKKIMSYGPSGRFECIKCFDVFSCNEKIDTTLYKKKKKDVPCKSSFLICAITYQYLKRNMFELNFDYNAMLNDILRNINYFDMYPRTCFDSHEHHKFFIIRFIVEEFIRIRANYVAKNATLREQEQMMRSKLKKIIINLGQ